MSPLNRLNYYRRIFPAYLTSQQSQLTFWHEVPEVNESVRPGELNEYYMPFTAKADYPGPYDEAGIPLLNYRGKLGIQYNPIAIAQYGLGNFNLFCRTGDLGRRQKFLKVADWLVRNLEKNHAGLWVWHHHFDWEYRSTLKAPWYSALAQGQGISTLVRAYQITSDPVYLNTATRAFETFQKTIEEGGVVFIDEHRNIWLEEYIVFPPTHILNGFIWASWGLYDYFLATGDKLAKRLFDEAVRTLSINLPKYDTGFWSLYEVSGTRLKMLASPFYHKLHVVQLKILFSLTGNDTFSFFSEKWEKYRRKRVNRNIALLYKIAFKLLYY